MADWTQLYKNPQTQQAFGMGIPPIPSPSVMPIGGWGNVDLSQAMKPPTPPQAPMPQTVQAPVAPQAEEPEGGGIGSILMMLLPLLLSGGAKRPNAARSSYMQGIMQAQARKQGLEMQSKKEKQAQAMALQEQQAKEQERTRGIVMDFYEAITEANPDALYDSNLIGFVQAGDLEGMKEEHKKGMVSGFTTNPSLMKKAGVKTMDGYINAFMDYLDFEKGLSANTREAYRRDLRKFFVQNVIIRHKNSIE